VARRNVIKLEYDTPATVIGIASHEKIWKLCWKVNQELQIALASAEEQVAEVAETVVYTDFESDQDFDFFLFENAFQSRKVSALARKFRYWLVIRHVREEAPDVSTLQRKLSGIDIVSLAHDLSDEKDIKKLLP